MYLLAVSISLLCLAEAVPGQARFEVASVKPIREPDRVNGGMRGGPGTADPTRIDYRTFLELLIEKAYDVRPYEVAGPDWLNTERYSLQATLPLGTSPEQLRTMLQTLLAERFGLQLHHETRIQPVYELSVAKGGPKLTLAGEAVTGGPDNPRMSLDIKRDADGCPIFVPGVTASGTHISGGVACGTYRKETMASLAHDVAVTLDIMDGVFRGGKTRVLDKTNLTGEYDFKLKYAFNPPSGGPTSEASTPSGDSPSLPEALEKQLGLHLMKTKSPVDVMVIDHVERVPTQN